MFLGCLAISFLISMGGRVATADIILFHDRTDFETATGATQTESFDSFLIESSFQTQILDIGDFSLQTSNNDLGNFNFVDIPPVTDYANVNGTTALNVLLSKTESLFFTFDTEMKAFGADFKGLSDGQYRSFFYVNGELINPGRTTEDPIRFFGFTSDTAFTTVELRAVNTGDAMGIDNLSYVSAIPEPSSIMLLSLAGMGLGIRVYRRRKSSRSSHAKHSCPTWSRARVPKLLGDEIDHPVRNDNHF